jgi:hypothetical protein
VYVVLDVWLIAVEELVLPAMIALVIQVGLQGVLCSRFIEPPWFRWIAYGWVWLLLDCMVIPFTSVSDGWGSIDRLAISLLSSQLGLATVWVVLGSARWSTRWPLGLVVVAILFVPVVWTSYSQRNGFMLLLFVQCLVLAATCGLLWWRGFRLIAEPGDANSILPADHTGNSQLAASQFGIRDLLLWTTSLAIVLALARAFDFWDESLRVMAWMRELINVKLGSGSTEIPLTATEAVLTAMVLLVALWAALGQGRARWRWSLLAAFAVTAGLGYGVFHFRLLTMPWGRNGWINHSFWEPRWRALFYSFEGPRIAWYCLAGGLLFATLLSFRTLGYRLCRVQRLRAQS